MQNFDTILENLINFQNQSTDEFNECFDRMAEAEAEVTKLKLELQEANKILAIQDQALRTQADTEERLRSANQTGLEKITVLSSSVTTLNKELKDLTKSSSTNIKEHKRMKEQIKRVKEANNKANAKIETLNKELVRLKADAKKFDDLTCIYDVDGEQLHIYPKRQKFQCGEYDDVQTFLLFSAGSGCYRSIALEEDNEPVVASFLNADNTLGERTISTFYKNSLAPSDKAKEFAKQWLIRVNRQQDGDTFAPDRITFKD